eukprot:4844067-Amphidinium_carterae.2
MERAATKKDIDGKGGLTSQIIRGTTSMINNLSDEANSMRSAVHIMCTSMLDELLVDVTHQSCECFFVLDTSMTASRCSCGAGVLLLEAARTEEALAGALHGWLPSRLRHASKWHFACAW